MKRLALWLAVAILVLWTVVPVYWVINISLMSPVERLAHPTHLYPHRPTLFNYFRILGQPAVDSTGTLQPPSGHSSIVLRGLRNSFVLTMVVTPLTLIIALPVAYALARLTFPYRNAWLFTIILGRSLPPISVLIPYFILFQTIGFHGTYAGMAILYLSISVPIIVWLMTTFFETLPASIEKEARVDGCTRLEAIYRIVLPLARPGIAASAAIAFLICWNEFTFSQLVGAGTSVQPYAPSVGGVLAIEMGAASDVAEAAAAMIIGILPSIVVAYFYQRNVQKLNIVQPF